MTAYIAKDTFWTVNEEGTPIMVPKGARVDEGDFYQKQNSDQFVEEESASFFGRRRSGDILIVTDATKAPVSTAASVAVYSDTEWEAWLEAEQVHKDSVIRAELEALGQAEPVAKSSLGAKRAPLKK